MSRMTRTCESCAFGTCTVLSVQELQQFERAGRASYASSEPRHLGVAVRHWLHLLLNYWDLRNERQEAGRQATAGLGFRHPRSPPHAPAVEAQRQAQRTGNATEKRNPNRWTDLALACRRLHHWHMDYLLLGNWNWHFHHLPTPPSCSTAEATRAPSMCYAIGAEPLPPDS